MAEIKRLAGMGLPEDHKDGPHCGITAISVISGCSMDRAKAAYRTTHWMVTGKSVPRGWSGWTYPTIVNVTLRGVFSVRLKKLDVSGWKTVRQFVVDHEHCQKTFLIATTGHYLVSKGPMVIDQGGWSPIQEYRYRRHRLDEIHSVVQ